MKRLSAARVCVVLTLAAALAGCWQIDDLGDLPGGPHLSEAYAINEGGDVVGYGSAADGNRAFVWRRGVGLTPLPLPAGTGACAAAGINDAGLVVGHCQTSGGSRKIAVVWSGAGVEAVQFPGRRVLSSELLAVNQAGDVVGGFREEVGRSFVVDSAFTWQYGSSQPVRGITPLPSDLGGSGVARAIGPLGWIAGHAYVTPHPPWLWNPASGRGHPVGALSAPASASGEARGINDQRQVVGVFDGRGFVWTPAGPGEVQGTTIEIPFEPYDINNRGQVVGVQGGRAVLYDLGTERLTVLEDLPEVRRAGWRRLALARAINDRGQIAGYGVNVAGDVSAFVMTPD
jgi:probable HAF family extracellular repeat protein